MPPTDEQPASETIITELRSLRESPSEQFSAELDAWAAAGFPPSDRAKSTSAARKPPLERLRRLRPPRLAPAIGVATAVLLAVVLAVTTTEEGAINEIGGDDSLESGEAPGGIGDSLPQSAERPSGVAERGSAGDSSVAAHEPTTVPPIPGPPDEKLKPGQDRVQERSASMTLSTEPGEVDDVADEVVDVVDRYEGIVVSSDVRTSSERGRASFDLRIPSANLQAALADFSDLASVSSRDEGTLDITTPFITAEERYKDAKAEVASLREQLSEADTTSEVDDLRERLQAANLTLVAARNELGSLKERSDYSVVSVTVLGDGDANGWSLGDAVDDAGNVLEDLAGATLVALAVIIPLGALALAGWLGLTALRRRQRERTLDQ